MLDESSSSILLRQLPFRTSFLPNRQLTVTFVSPILYSFAPSETVLLCVKSGLPSPIIVSPISLFNTSPTACQMIVTMTTGRDHAAIVNSTGIPNNQDTPAHRKKTSVEIMKSPAARVL